MSSLITVVCSVLESLERLSANPARAILAGKARTTSPRASPLPAPGKYLLAVPAAAPALEDSQDFTDPVTFSLHSLVSWF